VSTLKVKSSARGEDAEKLLSFSFLASEASEKSICFLKLGKIIIERSARLSGKTLILNVKVAR
jgi:hypothetical protein